MSWFAIGRFVVLAGGDHQLDMIFLGVYWALLSKTVDLEWAQPLSYFQKPASRHHQVPSAIFKVMNETLITDDGKVVNM